MRVTQNMLSNNMLRNVSNSYERMGKFQQQLATGKKISKPSDDPVVAMKGMNYRTELTEIEQYKRNVGEVHNWMDNSDAALDKTTQALQRLRELAVQGSNGTYEEGQRENIAKEVSQLKEHLKDIGNTKFNNKYIFNGNDTTTKPIDSSGVSSNSEPVNIEVFDGIKIQTNVNPQQVFSQDMFDKIDSFIGKLEGTESGDLDESIKDMADLIDNTVNARADLGARMNRVDLIEDRLASQEISATKNLSDAEDADMEKVITNLKTQESVHRAALGVGARIIQPSLMDFLR
ncbi:flagellar hook-associated protein FlgL [Pontibacillus yanchengensis]|uniref:Flagellar hook-associated protein FlgL n=1 Tax=Pontibacillus yanchengensis TaxID=462910 RepID=A0A6I5A3E1_9BACI|nr:flagellar hook-associated protein FlgL [Pontibacillus yanchengensis]MYL33971.1 flagellar hook-associated protein FlgL [Pontibacillus yanchengensis]